MQGGFNLKQYLLLVISEIKSSFFSEKSHEVTKEVISFIEGLKNENLDVALRKISLQARKEKDLNRMNLYHIAWRTLECHFVYEFEEGQEVIFNKRKRTIKNIDRKERKAHMENGDIISLSLLHNENREMKQKEVYEQLKLF